MTFIRVHSNLVLLIFVYLFCGSCTTLNYQIYIGQFRSAVDYIKKGEVSKAQEIFTELCTKKHKTSCLVSGREVGWYAGLPIMQGPTLETSTQFVLAHEDVEKLQIFVLDKERNWLWPHKRLITRPDGEKLGLVHVEFKDLKTQYEYQLVVVGGKSRLLDFRNFKTLETQGSELKLAVASCMRDDLKNSEDIWLDMENRGPEVIFMIGDNSYVDIGIKDQLFKMKASRLWQRHMETREKLRVFRWKNLVPVFATWDDHDYGTRDGDKSFELKNESEKIFQAFFPSGVGRREFLQGPGVSVAVKLRGHNFIFLDNRSFRDPTTKNGEGLHFGIKQNQWLGERLSKNNLNWLISGDQFFGGYHEFQSFQREHPNAFKAFLSKLREFRASYMFLSGDRHMSEVMSLPASYLGSPSYEFTSSPMHSSVYPGSSQKTKNPLRVSVVDGKWNYIFLQLKQASSNYQIYYESRGLGNEVYFKGNLELKGR